MLKRTLSLGSFLDRGQRHAVEVEVNVTDKPSGAALSITGSVWLPSRRDIIAGGQLQDSLLDYLTEPAYKRSDVDRLLAIWQRWHLNDMKAGSPAQELWLHENPISPDDYHYPKSYYEVACERLAAVGINPDPNFIYKDKPYSYGNAWLKEELPAEVIAEIQSW